MLPKAEEVEGSQSRERRFPRPIVLAKALRKPHLHGACRRARAVPAASPSAASPQFEGIYMTAIGQDTLNTRSTLKVGSKSYDYYSLAKAAEKFGDVSRLPFSMKVLLENMLRFEDGKTVTQDDVKAIVDWQKERRSDREIQYRPARVLMQDFTGVPCVVDLAAMRDAMTALGGDPEKINPQVPVHLVIDHSVMVDEFGTPQAFEDNVELEYQRNMERYEFLKWGSKALDNFSVVPPGTGICHQVNLEYIGQAVWSSKSVGANGDDMMIAYPDTLVGTDSHTTMINGLGVLGWGVGGIEAEAAMLGQPVSMLIPEVVGFKLTGNLAEGITATDLVLTVTQMLRAKGVVGRFVEFYRPWPCQHEPRRSRDDRQYGARIWRYVRILPDRRPHARLYAPDRAVGRECRAGRGLCQGKWLLAASTTWPIPIFTDTLELDMGSVVPSLAGPKRPQDKVTLDHVDDEFNRDLLTVYKKDAPRRVLSQAKTMISATAMWSSPRSRAARIPRTRRSSLPRVSSRARRGRSG